MRIEIKIGDLRIVAEGQAVRFSCPDLAVSGEQTELIARLLTLLSESLRTPSLPQIGPATAELAPAAQVSFASTPLVAAPRFAVRSAVSAPASQAVASAPVADAPPVQLEQAAAAPSPRFAVRSPGVPAAVVGTTATRVPGRTAALTPSTPAETTEAPVDSSSAPARRILGAAPAAPATPSAPAEVAAPAAVETPPVQTAPVQTAAVQSTPVRTVRVEAGAVKTDAPTDAPQAPVAVRRVMAAKSLPSSEPADKPTLDATADQTTPAPRRVLRPSTPAEAGAELVATPAPVAKTEGEAAPRRVLRPVEASADSAASPAAPTSSSAAPQRVVRPTAPAELPAAVTPPEPALRRSVRPTGAKEVAVEAVQADADSAVRRPGRPRQTPLNGQLSKDAAPASDETQAEPPVRRKPGRPLGSRNRVTSETAPAQAPGRPRKSPLNSPVAEPAPQLAAAPAAPASEPAPSESPAASADPQGESKGRTVRLVDRLDQWMRENPGPKTREQLLDVSIANSWVTGPDPGRIFSMCMNREKNLFTRMPDGNTEIYLRRAELAPPNTPGKLIRRPGSGKPTV